MTSEKIRGAVVLALALAMAGCGGSDNGSDTDGGTSGAAPSVASRSSAIAPGAQCPTGGIEVETGIDDNGNGVLDPGEVDLTQVVCNGENGASAAIKTTALAAGATCPAGGFEIATGVDDNGNGALDTEEVDAADVVCSAGAAAVAALRLELIGRYESGVFDEGAAEIVAHDPASQRLFVVNADAASVDVLAIADPSNPMLVGTIDASANWADAGGVNSVAVAHGLVAVAVENDDSLSTGRVQLYNAADLAFRGQADVGVLPDMVVFTPDGQILLLANEGQPADDYSVDPEGSVSLVDVSDPANPAVTTIGFADFNLGGPRSGELPAGVRVFGNFNPTALTVTAFTDTDTATLTVSDTSGLTAGDFFTLASSAGDPLAYRVAAVTGNVVTLTDDFDGDSQVADAGTAGLTLYLHDGASNVAQDLEPEYIAVAPDGATAWVTLQENNAVAEIDIAGATVQRILALQSKDHGIPGNEMDASNEDGRVNIRNWPLRGMYMPDSVASYRVAGQIYYLTANEGDAREYDAYVEEVEIEDVGIDPDSFDNAAALEEEAQLGSIATSLAMRPQADTDGDGLLDRLFVFGARSFTIWTQDGSLVYDSGSDFEVKTAIRFGIEFNNDNGESDPDGRSDNKGPEPEALTVAQFRGRHYAFIGLERIGGIMVYDVSNPATPTFVHYSNNRDFSIDIEAQIEEGPLPAGAAGDLGPESVVFIPAAESPVDGPLLVVGNEVSGTTTIYQVVGETP